MAPNRMLGKREHQWVGANGASALAACFDAIIMSENACATLKCPMHNTGKCDIL
jgi:hypothetical protein